VVVAELLLDILGRVVPWGLLRGGHRCGGRLPNLFGELHAGEDMDDDDEEDGWIIVEA